MKHETFEKYQLPSFLMEALKTLKFNEPTDIQQKIIPLVLKNKSVIGQSQTGSGKSHSFLLPILSKIDATSDTVQAVITTPSRELANQLYQAAKVLIQNSAIGVMNVTGGTDKKRQIDRLATGGIHVVIGTPGRILDLMKEQALDISRIQTLVIDEADMTLDLGFLNDVDDIASRGPKNLQMLVFSATIPEKLKPFLRKYMENPIEVTIENKSVVATTITNQLLSTKGQPEIDVLYEVLTLGQPYLAMVFANTKQKVEELTFGLRQRGLKVAMIHGDVPARERKRLMNQIQNLDYQYIVATDLAARGIDIEGVSLVVNIELPKDLDFFVHRVGRTGRNKLAGEAITFYQPSMDHLIVQLEKRGITFQHVTIKDGELVETFDRRRRKKRENTQVKQPDAVIKGMVKKAKQKVKPGYKRKLKEEIQQRERRKRRQQKRLENRKTR